MTTEDLAMLVTGMILLAGAFSCGVLVGTSLRKDATDDDSDEGTKVEGSSGWWHEPVRSNAAGGTQCGGPCRAGKERQTRAPERAPVGRGSVWE